eukprot:144719-Chlamydomonas_euryale.AAC.1
MTPVRATSVAPDQHTTTPRVLRTRLGQMRQLALRAALELDGRDALRRRRCPVASCWLRRRGRHRQQQQQRQRRQHPHGRQRRRPRRSAARRFAAQMAPDRNV